MNDEKGLKRAFEGNKFGRGKHREFSAAPRDAYPRRDAPRV